MKKIVKIFKKGYMSPKPSYFSVGDSSLERAGNPGFHGKWEGGQESEGHNFELGSKCRSISI